MMTTNTMIRAQVGKPAPDFRAKAYVDGQIKEVGLKDYPGKWVCLFFYPLDFTFVCPTEIRGFAQSEAKFKELNCQVISCSTDSHASHKAWFERDLKEVKFPVLADNSHKISSEYGVLLEDKGIAMRATFLIDPQGVVQHMSVNAGEVGRSVEETLRTLAAYQTGERCPLEWKPGQPMLGKP